MRISQDRIKHIDFYLPEEPETRPSFIVLEHPETRTLILKEWSEGSLQRNYLPLAIQQLQREYINIAKDVILLIQVDNVGYYRLTYDIKKGSGMMPASSRHYSYDVSNIKVEFYSKELKTHETLYGSEK